MCDACEKIQPLKLKKNIKARFIKRYVDLKLVVIYFVVYIYLRLAYDIHIARITITVCLLFTYLSFVVCGKQEPGVPEHFPF